MPPWPPAHGFASFADSRALTTEERTTLLAWIAAGAPAGDPARAPVASPVPDGWELGPPALELAMPKAYKVRAEGRDVFRNFVLPTGLGEDRWLAGVELRCDNKRVLHHAFVTVDAAHRGRKLDAQAKGPGFGGIDFGAADGMAAVWAPGARAHRFPAGAGLLVPKGSDLVLQMHLQPTGRVEEVRCTIGLYFHADRPKRLVSTLPLRIKPLRIPAGEAAYTVSKKFTLPHDIDALAIFPHMHWLGREVKVTARTPDRRTIPLVWIRRWSFLWQDLYAFHEPIPLPRGTRVELRFVFDNSAANPDNPHDPPKVVHWGSRSIDEMALVLLQVSGMPPPKPRAKGLPK